MNIEYTGRQTDVTKKLKVQAETGLERIGKIVGKVTSAHVILNVDKYRKIAEVTLTAGGRSLVANCESVEMQAALHDALEKIEQQAVRRRQRFTTTMRHPKGAGKIGAIELTEGAGEAPPGRPL